MGIASEAVLAELCQRSFLSLWSYPNPFNDKGLAQRKEGKELCDLLVIFGNDVIIFSDKSCAFPDTGDEALDWQRWYRRAVQESIDQIRGAERWLKQYPQRVFADNRCSAPLDVSIPSAREIRVHRVVVALGARQRCRNHFGGGSGSLPISGGGPATAHQARRRVFSLGDEGKPHGFVHVFDDVGLHVVLRELDTIADFVEYLQKKEALFDTHGVIATGEEDLLGHYLLNEHSFLPDDADQTHEAPSTGVLFVDESAYQGLTVLPQYRESKRANEPSYIWDSLIEHFTGYFRRGQLAEASSAEDFERSVRIMASTNRVVRRQLGRMVASAAQNTPKDRLRFTSVINPMDNGTAIGIVCKSYRGDVPYDVYRHRRQLLMELYARSLRVRSDLVRRALIVGFQPVVDDGSSEDLALVDLEDWSPELEAQTRSDMELFGITAAAQHFTEYEYPLATRHLGSKEAQRRRKQMERQAKKKDGRN